MRKVLVITTLLLLIGCTSRHDSRRAPELISNMTSADTIMTNDYILAVDELELMLAEVCDMADSLTNSGVGRADVRDSLRQNKRYLMLTEQASVLDSLVLEYMNRPYNVSAAEKVRKKYNGVLRRYDKRAHALGLN